MDSAVYAGFIGGCQDHWFNDGAGQAKMNDLWCSAPLVTAAKYPQSC